MMSTGNDVVDEELPDFVYPATAPLTPFAKRMSAVFWPAFLMAAVMEIFVFAFVDPSELHWLGGAAVELSRTSVYTMAFFVFWIVIGLSGALTQLLLREPDDINHLEARRRFP